MSEYIDERIVSIKFDNSGFAEGVSETQKSLDNLNKSLQFEGANEGGKALANTFKDISTEAKKTDLSPVGKAVENIGEKFNVLETIATGVFLKIGADAVEMGKKLIKSVSIDPIASGFDKYENILTSQMTLTAALGDTSENQEQIANTLNKLTWFADETSYSLEDMTKNISQFTNYGIDLKDAEEAMIGIANASAKSGAPIANASHAMEGFSKAMGQGYMSYQVWRTWLNTSKITTLDFKDTIIDTAKEIAASGGDVGAAIYKNGELYVDMGKTIGMVQVTAENLESTLTKGQWLTKNVMLESLKKYSVATNDIYDQYQKTGKSVQSIIDQNGDSLDQFSLEAFKYAQQCKTLSEVVESMNDAISTQWYKIFQALVGDYKETVDLWSNIAEYVFEWFVYPLQRVADFIVKFSTTVGSSGKTMRELIVESLYNILDAINSVLNPIKEAFKEIFMPEGLDGLAPTLQKGIEGFNKFTASLILTKDQGEKVKNVFKFIFTLFKNGLNIVKTVIDIFKKLYDTIKNLFSNNDNSNIKNFFSDIKSAISNSDIDFSVFENLCTKFEELGEKILNAYEKIKGAISKIKNIFNKDTIDGAVEDSDSNNFTVFDKLIEKLSLLHDKLDSVKEHSDKVKDSLKNIINGIKDYFEKYDIGGKLTEIFDVNNLIRIMEIMAQLFLGNRLLKISENIGTFFERISSSLKLFQINIGNNNNLKATTVSIDDITDLIKVIIGAIVAMAAVVFIIGNMDIENFEQGLAALGSIVTIFSGLFATLYKLISIGGSTNGGLAGNLQMAINSLFGPTRRLKEIGKILIYVAIAILIIVMGFNKVIDAIKDVSTGTWLKAVATISIISGIIALLMLEIFELSKTDLNESQSKAIKSIGVAIIEIAVAIKLITDSFTDLMAGLNSLTEPKAWQDSILTLVIILLAVAGLMAETAALAKWINPEEATNLNKIGTSMLLIAVAIKLITDSFTDILKALEQSDPERSKQALIIMGVLLGVIAGLIALFAGLGAADLGAGIQDGAKALATMAVGILAISAAIWVLIDALKMGVEILILIGDNTEKIINGLNAVKEALPIIKDIIIGVITALITAGIQAIANSIVEITKIIVDGLVSILEELAKAAPKILAALEKILPLVTQIITLILQSVFTALNDAMPQFREWFMNLLDLVEEAIGDLLQFLIDEGVPKLEEIIGMILAFLLDEVLPKLKDAIIDFVKWLGDLGVEIVKSLTKIWTAVQVFITDILFPGIEEIFKSLLDLIDKLIMDLLTFLENGVTNWGNKIIDIVVALIKVIENGVKRITDALESLLLTIADSVYSFFETGGRVIAKLLLIPKAIADGFMKEIKSKFGIKDDGKAKTSGAIYKFGKNIIDGLIAGIKALFKSIKKAAKWIWDTFKKAFTAKDAANISSPSKAMYAFGEYIGEGLVNGVEDSSKIVAKSASNLWTSFSEPIMSEIDSFTAVTSSMLSQLLDADMDFNPVITPVFDMSNLDAASSSMSAFFDAQDALEVAGSFNGMQKSRSELQNNQNEGNSAMGSGPTYNYVQNNYSPKALSAIEIYRRTKNQLNFKTYLS
mgnify:CR=1 FL=1